MKSGHSDYLKYWRVIRYFYKVKYGLSQSDLEILLFLYSEKYFSRDKFKQFDSLLPWDTKRFNRLLNDGWVEVFRRRMGHRRALYELSYKGIRLVDSIYKKLNGEEIASSVTNNPMFYKNVRYTDKVYRNMIVEMNKFIRQQRHLPPE